MSEQNKKIESGEQTPEMVVMKHNLKMLNIDMLTLLGNESIGGNAGGVDIDGKKYPCAAANGFADPKTGEIIVFDNIQHVPRKIVENNVEFTLRVALDWKNLKFMKIVNFLGSDNFSAKGKLAIETAITEWNKEHQIINDSDNTDL